MTGSDVAMRRFLAVSVVIGFFGALAALLFLPDLNQNVRETVAMLIGVLGAKFGTVYDFAFGDAERERLIDGVHLGAITRGDSGLPVSGEGRDEHG